MKFVQSLKIKSIIACCLMAGATCVAHVSLVHAQNPQPSGSPYPVPQSLPLNVTNLVLISQNSIGDSLNKTVTGKSETWSTACAYSMYADHTKFTPEISGNLNIDGVYGAPYQASSYTLQCYGTQRTYCNHSQGGQFYANILDWDDFFGGACMSFEGHVKRESRSPDGSVYTTYSNLLDTYTYKNKTGRMIRCVREVQNYTFDNAGNVASYNSTAAGVYIATDAVISQVDDFKGVNRTQTITSLYNCR